MDFWGCRERGVINVPLSPFISLGRLNWQNQKAEAHSEEEVVVEGRYWTKDPLLFGGLAEQLKMWLCELRTASLSDQTSQHTSQHAFECRLARVCEKRLAKCMCVWKGVEKGLMGWSPTGSLKILWDGRQCLEGPQKKGYGQDMEGRVGLFLAIKEIKSDQK